MSNATFRFNQNRPIVTRPSGRSYSSIYSGMVNALDYVTATGSSDDTAGLQAAVAEAESIAATNGAGCRLYLPTAAYNLTTSLTISSHRIHIYGDGPYATMVTFTPTVAGTPAVLFSSGSELVQCSIRHLAIVGAGSVRKVGIKYIDTSDLAIEDVHMLTFSTPGWATTADSSIGIQGQGRQSTVLRGLNIHADRPISFENNPLNGISCDHTRVSECDLNAVTGNGGTDSVIAISNSTSYISNLTVANCSGEGGGNFFAIGGGVVASTSENITLRSCRWEQPTSATGYMVNIDRNLHNLRLDDMKAGSGARGYYLRNVLYPTFINAMYDGTGVYCDVDETCVSVLYMNSWGQTGSTSNIGNLVEVFSTGPFSAGQSLIRYLDRAGGPRFSLGPTVLSVSAINNLAAGGAIGTAANTVDKFSGFTINQTTAGQTITLPGPTNTTAGRMATVSNIGTQSFTMLGASVATGASIIAVWNGSAWGKVT